MLHAAAAVNILSPDGVVLSTVTHDGAEEPTTGPIYNLWAAARDSASPAGPVIDAMLKDLSDDDDIPF